MNNPQRPVRPCDNKAYTQASGSGETYYVRRYGLTFYGNIEKFIKELTKISDLS